jgi:hypothetical protein
MSKATSAVEKAAQAYDRANERAHAKLLKDRARAEEDYERALRKNRMDCEEATRHALEDRAEDARQMGAQIDPANPEPVAWIWDGGDSQELDWEMPTHGDAIPLYTFPQLAKFLKIDQPSRRRMV